MLSSASNKQIKRNMESTVWNYTVENMYFLPCRFTNDIIFYHQSKWLVFKICWRRVMCGIFILFFWSFVSALLNKLTYHIYMITFLWGVKFAVKLVVQLCVVYISFLKKESHLSSVSQFKVVTIRYKEHWPPCPEIRPTVGSTSVW